MSFASLSKFLGCYSPLCANRSLPGLKSKSPSHFRGTGHVPQAARPLGHTACHEATAQHGVTQSREQSSPAGRGPSLPSPRGPGQTLPHRGDNLLTLLSQPKLSPAQGYLPWDLHRGFFSRWIPKQPGALWKANAFPADLSSFCTVSLPQYLHSRRSALPVERPELASSPASHQQHRCAERTWRELSAARSKAGSAQARPAASLPPPPLPEHPSPRLPGDGHSCFELLCQITLPRANHSA